MNINIELTNQKLIDAGLVTLIGLDLKQTEHKIHYLNNLPVTQAVAFLDLLLREAYNEGYDDGAY